jgi:hypothetical protein
LIQKAKPGIAGSGVYSCFYTSFPYIYESLLTSPTMTRLYYADAFFILLAAAVLVLINEFAPAGTLTNFSFLLVFAAYLIGRRVGERNRK